MNVYKCPWVVQSNVTSSAAVPFVFKSHKHILTNDTTTTTEYELQVVHTRNKESDLNMLVFLDLTKCFSSCIKLVWRLWVPHVTATDTSSPKSRNQTSALQLLSLLTQQLWNSSLFLDVWGQTFLMNSVLCLTGNCIDISLCEDESREALRGPEWRPAVSLQAATSWAALGEPRWPSENCRRWPALCCRNTEERRGSDGRSKGQNDSQFLKVLLLCFISPTETDTLAL